MVRWDLLTLAALAGTAAVALMTGQLQRCSGVALRQTAPVLPPCCANSVHVIPSTARNTKAQSVCKTNSMRKLFFGGDIHVSVQAGGGTEKGF